MKSTILKILSCNNCGWCTVTGVTNLKKCPGCKETLIIKDWKETLKKYKIIKYT